MGVSRLWNCVTSEQRETGGRAGGLTSAERVVMKSHCTARLVSLFAINSMRALNILF